MGRNEPADRDISRFDGKVRGARANLFPGACYPPSIGAAPRRASFLVRCARWGSVARGAKGSRGSEKRARVRGRGRGRGPAAYKRAVRVIALATGLLLIRLKGLQAVQGSTVQYDTVRYSTIQYDTVRYSTIQYHTYHDDH
jgi:hypothetical protein